jgi:hypothetical protein
MARMGRSPAGGDGRDGYRARKVMMPRTMS